MNAGSKPQQSNLLKEALALGKTPFIFAALFSLASNLLYMALPIYTNQIYGRVMYSHSGATLIVLTVGTVFVFLISSLLDHYRAQVLNNFGVVFDRQLASGTFAAMFDLVVRRRGGAQAQGLRDLDTVRGILSGGAILVVFDVPWIPIFIGILFVIDPWIGALTFVGGLILLILAVLQDRSTHASMKEQTEATIKSYSFTDAALRNAEIVRALGMLPTLGAAWAHYRNSAQQMGVVTNDRSSFYQNAIRFIRMLLQILTVGVGAWLIIKGDLASGLLFANMILSARALAPIDRIVGSWKMLFDGAEAYRRLNDMLEQFEPPVPTTQLPIPTGKITFEHVSFAPMGASALVLLNMSFAVQPGEMVGIIGPSGAGKSTLLRVMTGIWKPNSGTARLDGADVYSWDRADFGRHVAYQPQDTELFAGTVRANICRFSMNADDADIIRAAQAAGAHDLILRLPKGYETELGEGGATLSAGQRQRVGLARTLYRDPKVIILDEPNANLDAEGEAALLAALSSAKERGATIILVSHKPSIFASADKLMVIRGGHITQYGPRDEVTRALQGNTGTRPALSEVKP